MQTTYSDSFPHRGLQSFRLPIAFLVLFLLVLATSGFSEVPMFRGNPRLTGVLNEDPVSRLKGVKFTFSTAGAVRSTPAISENTLLFGSADGTLYALDAQTGKQQWGFQTGGAVNSSPTVARGIVYFSSRDGYLYAIRLADPAKPVWKFQMQSELPFENGYDYFLSSATIVDEVLYTGSGDGNLYALRVKNGQVLWRYSAGARIRTTPAVTQDSVIFGALNGVVYSVNRKDGVLRWKFETEGAHLRFEDVGYDQTSIICSPAVDNQRVYVGGRDGFLYAIDINSGKQLWKVSHDRSWVLATGVDSESVYASSGSSAFVQAVDPATGKEKWRFKANGIVYSSPILVHDLLYFTDYSGNLYALDKHTGIAKWVFPMGARSFASPVVSGGNVYAAADNGIVFALEGAGPESTPLPEARRIVYYQGPRSTEEVPWFDEGARITIRDHFKDAGYELANALQIQKIVNELIKNGTRSIIVFADNKFPGVLLDDTEGVPLIRKYLDSGGKIALLKPNPAGLQLNPETGEYRGIDFGPVETIFGVHVRDRALINFGSRYTSRPTEEGLRWGLRGWWVGASSVDPADVSTVLAVNEHGQVTSWVKNYGGPEGTGLLQLDLPVGTHLELNGDFLSILQAAIEHGITW